MQLPKSIASDEILEATNTYQEYNGQYSQQTCISTGSDSPCVGIGLQTAEILIWDGRVLGRVEILCRLRDIQRVEGRTERLPLYARERRCARAQARAIQVKGVLCSCALLHGGQAVTSAPARVKHSLSSFLARPAPRRPGPDKGGLKSGVGWGGVGWGGMLVVRGG